jgi:hypothetical protein
MARRVTIRIYEITVTKLTDLIFALCIHRWSSCILLYQLYSKVIVVICPRNSNFLFCFSAPNFYGNMQLFSLIAASSIM